MALEPIFEGKSWAYRKARGPLEEVTVLKVVSQSGNSRVRIQFENGPNAGQSQWVSRRMLKTPWQCRGEFLARETRWREARSRAGLVPEHELDAAAIVIDATIDQAIASDQGDGILAVRDLPALLLMVGSKEDVPVEEGFTEAGTTYLPWPAMLVIAKDRARSSSTQVLREIEAQETARDAHELHMRQLDALSPWASNGPVPFAKEAENLKLSYALAREWCGAEATDKWAELTQLRDELARLSGLLEQALEALEQAGKGYQANRLRGQAGPGFKKRAPKAR